MNRGLFIGGAIVLFFLTSIGFSGEGQYKIFAWENFDNAVFPASLARYGKGSEESVSVFPYSQFNLDDIQMEQKVTNYYKDDMSYYKLKTPGWHRFQMFLSVRKPFIALLTASNPPIRRLKKEV